MQPLNFSSHFKYSYESRLKRKMASLRWQAWHIDPLLLALLLLLSTVGLFILFSATNGNITMVGKQGLRLVLAFLVMLLFAYIPPKQYYEWAPWVFGISVLLLISVLIFGGIDNGARRWLNLW